MKEIKIQKNSANKNCCNQRKKNSYKLACSINLIIIFLPLNCFGCRLKIVSQNQDNYEILMCGINLYNISLLFEIKPPK